MFIRRKWKALLIVLGISFISCGVPYNIQQGNKMLISNNYSRALLSYRMSLLSDSEEDSCLGIFGCLYTDYLLLKKRNKQILKLFEEVNCSNVPLEVKIENIRKIKELIEDTDRYLSIYVGKKGQECSSLNACNLCRYNTCKVRYLVLLLDRIRKKNPGCSYEKFRETFEEKSKRRIDKNFDYHVLLSLLDEFEKLRKEYKQVHIGVIEQYLREKIAESESYQQKGEFVKAYWILKEAQEKLKSIPYVEKKYLRKIDISFQELSQNLSRKLKDKLKSCSNNETCRLAVYLYSSLFYLPLDVRYNSILVDNLKKEACISFSIHSNDESLERYLISYLQQDKGFSITPRCSNILDIALNNNIFVREYKDTKRDYAYYSSLPVKEYEYGRAISELFFSTHYECTHCKNPQRCLFDVKDHFKVFLSKTEGLGFTIPYTITDLLFEANYAKSLYSTLSIACMGYKDFRAYNKCIERQKKKIDEAYRDRLKNLCSWIRNEYFSKRRLLNTKAPVNRLTYEKIERVLLVESRANVKVKLHYGTKTEEGNFFEMEKDKQKREGIRIIEGDYKRACEYARFYSRFAGKPTKCVRPSNVGKFDVVSEREKVKRLLANKIVERIRNSYSPMVFLREELADPSRPFVEKIKSYFKMYLLYPQEVKNRKELILELEKFLNIG